MKQNCQNTLKTHCHNNFNTREQSQSEHNKFGVLLEYILMSVDTQFDARTPF